MAMSARERRAANFLHGYGLTVEKVPETKTRTPDFRVETVDGFMFFAEVKAIDGKADDEAYLWSEQYNRLTKDIEHSVKQLGALNSQRLVPNVLVVLAEDFRIHGQSVLDFFKGAIEVDGQTIADLSKYRRGRVAAILGRIDLYIVLDAQDTPTFFFTGTDRRFTERLARVFRVGATGTSAM